MRPAELLEELHRQGFTLIPRAEGKLVVQPATQLTEELRALIRLHKGALLAAVQQRPRPFITPRGELIIPCDCEPKYRWWAGGQSIRATLLELQAPLEVRARYVEPAGWENVQQ